MPQESGDRDTEALFWDIIAGPFVGAPRHSREWFEVGEQVRNPLGPLPPLDEAANVKAGEFDANPLNLLVEGGLSGANAFNQAMNGDLGGAAKTMLKANGGVLCDLFDVMF